MHCYFVYPLLASSIKLQEDCGASPDLLSGTEASPDLLPGFIRVGLCPGEVEWLSSFGQAVHLLVCLGAETATETLNLLSSLFKEREE